MWQPTTLPYYCDPRALPAPLPTQSEISAPTLEFRPDRNLRKTVAIGKHFLVKYGHNVQQREGETLLFLKHALPSFPSPDLYAMYRDDTTGEFYLIMSLLPGKNLEEIWPTLDDSDKGIITGKLRDIFKQMRDLPSPGFYGDVCRCDLNHALFWTADLTPSVSGPFCTEHDLNMGLVAKLQNKIRGEYGGYGGKASYYARNLSGALHGHRPTFSHSDVVRRNILVQEIAPEGSAQGKTFDIAIVDWEHAGWYPTYWDFVSVAMFFPWDGDDWPARMEEFLTPWPAELAVLQILFQEIQF